jgi:hypothetical protein
MLAFSVAAASKQTCNLESVAVAKAVDCSPLLHLPKPVSSKS